MNTIDKSERETQNRIIALFQNDLEYTYLGNWIDRENNSNIEPELAAAYLSKAGYSKEQIDRTLHLLRTEAGNHSRSLYENNKAVYSLLRYGAKVKIDTSKNTEDVCFINWNEPEKNHFAIAEEVTLKGGNERRPDIVLYVNGIALAVCELKNSRVSIGEGIRQNLSNQRSEFNEWFFSTVQFVFAGNDSEGLQYGTIGTQEKYFLKWKEDEHDNDGYKLDKYITKICAKRPFLEIIHDFVLFDGGVKKLPRAHQYFGIKAAQEHVRRREGGIIWHTQGSGKSIVMVLLAKWILENNHNARVVVITDRDELDKQIDRVFRDAGELIHKARSGRDLVSKLEKMTPRLLCSLVHKFGARGVDDFDAFIKELESQPSTAVGELFVFVDECHRTQSGRLHRAMKAIMPNAVFIGFTGTPLLRKDKQTTFEVFGGYIHTYKFNEAVEDEVVLDLIYEARDIDQELRSQDKIDAWFDAKTKGLNKWQKDELMKRWGTMRNVLSSRSRMEQIVNDILLDFDTKRRLNDDRGNAILVASSIYEACKYYTLFQNTPFKGKCALVTSYDPQARDISKEDVGSNSETDKEFVYNTYVEMLKSVDIKGSMSKTEAYEERAKKLFINEPANMKLLIVVDKLLTGFDAPPCSYLYIDKSMQDHGLFQAICRTNRLDGEDKDFGHIVDYKDLFRKMENAISVYTSELDDSAEGSSPDVLLKDRRKIGKEKLENALEAVTLLCEPVSPPKSDLNFIRYFCGNTEIESDLQEKEQMRVALYKAVATLVRSYANISDELEPSGFSKSDVERIQNSIEHYLNVRTVIQRASGETIDLKPYEADMRHLIDTYIKAEDPKKISPFDDIGLVDLIVKSGIAKAINNQLGGLKGDRDAIAESIENNIRKKIIKEHLTDPAYYEKMSKLLEELIIQRKAKAIEYEEFLKQIAELAKKVSAGCAADTPSDLNTPGKVALYNNLKARDGSDCNNDVLDSFLNTALSIDRSVKENRPDSWRGVPAKEQMVKKAIYEVLADADLVETIFQIIKQHKEY